MLLPVYSENTPYQCSDEHFVLTLFKTPSDWLRIRVICQHYFQTHSPASIKLNRAFPLRNQERKSTQITQYNLYVERQLF